MFTGLIADLGQVSALELGEGGAVLTVGTRLAAELSEGDSIAVNGVCLTAIEVGDGSFKAEAMSETLERTTLGRISEGSLVNIEVDIIAKHVERLLEARA